MNINIQGQNLLISAVIVRLSGPNILLGQSTLAELNSTLDFATNRITIKSTKVQFSPYRNLAKEK